MAYAAGQDWSSFQAAAPSTSGLSFVFIKATEGTSYVNPLMVQQAAHARAAGLVVGFYHFLRPGSMTAQAAFFVEKCASVAGDLLAADWEVAGVSGAEKDAFLAEVKRLRPTHLCLLYSNVNFWTTRDTTSNAGDGLWIATDGYPAGQPPIQFPWAVHQFSTAGGVDHDVYNGTAAELRAWAVGAAPVPVKPTPPTPAPTPPEEDDMLPVTSLGHTKPQPLPWNRWTPAAWDVEYADHNKTHANGTYPGYVAPVSSWARFLAQGLRVTGMASGDQLQIRYEVHDWKGGKSTHLWDQIVFDELATPGDQFAEVALEKGLTAGQHVYVALQPIPAKGRAAALPPRLIAGRWTIDQRSK